MTDEIFHQMPAPAAEPAEVVQPSTEAPQGVADGTGVSAPAAETEQQVAAREQEAAAIRAKRNNRAMIERLARERDEYRQIALEAARRNTQPPPQVQAPAEAPDAPPSRDKFERWEDYEAALVSHQVDQKLKAHQARQVEEVKTAMERMQREQYAQGLISAHVARTEEFARHVPDFEEVTAREDIIIPPTASEAIMGLPNSPAVLYAIGQSPELAATMQRLPPAQQAAYVGQISASLMYRQPQVSKAPPPGAPVGGRGSAQSEPTTASAYYDQITRPWRGKR